MKYEIRDTLYKQIQDITGTDYERIGKDIPVENIESIIKDLIYEIHRLEEKIEDIEQDRNDNYRQLTSREMYGVNDWHSPINI